MWGVLLFQPCGWPARCPEVVADAEAVLLVVVVVVIVVVVLVA